jgi:hypothetical protein|tara:strand:- start:865 stop:1209 length:345 start_codon:yes stop_codon:yes gene_type:complete
MKKKLIISEKQLKGLTTHVLENTRYQHMVEVIVNDLEKNYKKAIETREDIVAGDYVEKKVFEIKVSGEIIEPLALSEYIQKKYKVSEKFSQQILDDWCSGSINNGLLSKNVTID